MTSDGRKRGARAATPPLCHRGLDRKPLSLLRLDLFVLPLGLDTFAISAALRLHSAKQVAIDVLRPARKPLHPLALARQTS